jgi:hypothetical protein
MIQKFCKLSTCGVIIPSSRHGNAETCCDEHANLLKKKREQANYQFARKISKAIIANNRTLRLLALKFGYEVPIPFEELEKYNYDWNVSSGTFQIDGITGFAVGDHAIIALPDHKIKIYKND